MSDPKPITAWAVVGCTPKGGRFVYHATGRTKLGAIRAFGGALGAFRGFGGAWSWKIWSAKGYTCERVVVSLAPKRKTR